MGKMVASIPGIVFIDYVNESQLDAVMSLVGNDLSEPYSSKLVEREAWIVRPCFAENLRSNCQSLRIGIFFQGFRSYAS
jgi:hypothetical protein